MGKGDNDGEEEKKALRQRHRPQCAAVPLWRRVLWRLPSVFILCCYVLTAPTVVSSILRPLVARTAYGGLCAVFYALSLGVTLVLWLRVGLLDDAGSVPESWLDAVERGEVSRAEMTFCHRCRCPRPLRAHHCGTCGRCVLAFDHHCPWTGGDIGHGNKKLFNQYLWSNTCFCISVAAMTLYKTLVLGPVLYGVGATFTYCFAARGFGSCVREFNSDLVRHNGLLAELAVLVVFVLSLAFGIGTIVLGIYHLLLLSRNETTLEDGMEPNEFHLGSRAANARLVCGPSLFWGAFSPFFTSLGDGTKYERNLKKIE